MLVRVVVTMVVLMMMLKGMFGLLSRINASLKEKHRKENHGILLLSFVFFFV